LEIDFCNYLKLQQFKSSILMAMPRNDGGGDIFNPASTKHAVVATINYGVASIAASLQRFHF
jgi:hypothetical protein